MVSDWAKLSMLKTLIIRPLFTCEAGCQLSNLTCLQHLSDLYIHLQGNTSAETAIQLADLAYQLATWRPKVNLSIRGDDV